MNRKVQNIVKILIILLFLQLTGCGQKSIHLSDGYPVWLKTDNIRTDQTSGLTFIEKKNGISKFLMVDDVGAIYLMNINEQNTLNIQKYTLTEEIINEFKQLPKIDFEAITYDRYTGDVYLSVEGNKPDPQEFTRIYKLYFENNDLNSGVINKIELLHITPREDFTKYIGANIAFEGIAVGEKYLYLGLEGFRNGMLFADSTKILFVDKQTHKIEQVIGTSQYNIHTICGLSVAKDGSLWGIDRNDRKIFTIGLQDIELTSVELFPVEPAIPAFTHLTYTMALESITIDDDGNLYLTDDPWKTFYVPTSDILKQLDDATIKNFEAFVPILYKFSIAE